MFIELASAEIRGYTDQVLSEVASDVVVFEPTWSQTLYLPERPVTAVTSVTVGLTVSMSNSASAV